MSDWYKMKVVVEKLPTSDNLYRYTVGRDVIDIELYIYGFFFEEIKLKPIRHYVKQIGGGKHFCSSARTNALYQRIYTYFRFEYLNKLKAIFNNISCLDKADGLPNSFNFMGYTFREGSTPTEVFNWIHKHYTSTCAAGDFYELLKQENLRTDGFFAEEIRNYLN